jgi:hypothetical protein
MTTPMTKAGAQPRRPGRSVAAVFAGFMTVVVLSLGTDQLLHVLHVYPPWGQSMYEPRLNFLALSYRIVFTVAGGYVTARLAPHSPMRHVWTLGFIGLAFGVAGVFAAMPMHLGPLWYPIAIAVTALPCTWLGGLLYGVRHPGR